MDERDVKHLLRYRLRHLRSCPHMRQFCLSVRASFNETIRRQLIKVLTYVLKWE